MNKTILVGQTQEELEALCEAGGEPPYRGRQLAVWIYKKAAGAFDEMIDLPQDFRARLAEHCLVRGSRVSQTQQSSDGTLKSLIELNDAETIEMVVIPADDRLTVCLSTQVGCAAGCIFCASGSRGFVRNLSAGEIVEQVLFANAAAREVFQLERISNIVLMGIGEPLMNYDNVLKAIRIINAPWGVGIGARSITLSTVGLPDMIEKLAGENLQINLAISFHALDDETRNQIVPLNREIGVRKVLEAARSYFQRTGREVTFEIVLIAGVNATKRRALTLAAALKDIRCNVNVIPLNATAFSDLKPPAPPVVDEFCATLRRHGLNVNLRRHRGRDIDAACGQLRLKNLPPETPS